jgi:UDP-glucose 4-epimerase
VTTKNVLVTGGFGFLGSHLVERLLQEPATHVHVVDDMSGAALDVTAYLRRLGCPQTLTFHRMTVAAFCKLTTCDRHGANRFDEIYHLASVVGPVGVLAHAGHITASVVTDTYRMIELAQKHQARLCDVSTSEVYGGGAGGHCTETAAKIISPNVTVRLEYAVAKLACEIALVNTARTSDLFAVVIRPFNIAGPRQSAKGGFVLPRFIHQALRGEPLTVYGTGEGVRAFTHVEDVVDGLLRALRNGQSGKVYNIGNPANKTTVLDLAQRVVRLTESQSKIDRVDPKTLFGPLFAEANDKFPDSSRAQRELGWQPQHDLDRVVRDAIEYIRAERRD